MVAVPIVVGAWLGQKLDEAAGTAPWGLLGLVFLGMLVAGLAVAYMLRRYMAENPVGPVTDSARQAGRSWQAEIDERERKRDAGEDTE
jgi:F0F1-type ATP synthase assembly protein I